MSNNNECYKYKIQWWNLFIPTILLYKKPCESADKTYMFIIVMLRIMFYFFLFYILYDNIVGYIALLIIIIANIFSLILVFFKQQLIPKKKISLPPTNIKIHYPLKIPKPILKTRAELKLEAILQAEADARFKLLANAIQISRANIIFKKNNEYEMKRVLFNHLFYHNPNVISSI